MAEPSFYPRLRWFQTSWGAIVIIIAAVIILITLLFAGLVGYYWWQIRQGKGEAIMGGFEKERSILSGANQKNFSFMSGYTGARGTQVSGMTYSSNNNKQDLESVTAHILGNPAASTTIVEFLDFKCPNSRASADVVKRIAQTYGKRVKILLRHFPSESIHPGAMPLAELAHCAYEQGNFWGAHDMLFKEQDRLPADLSESDLIALGAQVGLDQNELQSCLRSGRARAAVNRDFSDGFKFGVVGTPTFFVNGVKIEGTVPWESWERYFEMSNIQ